MRILIEIASRRPRVFVLGLVAVGVLIMVMVRQAMLIAGASQRTETLAVFAAILLYGVWVNFFLVKRIVAEKHRSGAASGRMTPIGANPKSRTQVMGRLLFQALLFGLGSWLLIVAPPDSGEIARLPLSMRLLIVTCALCLMIWRVLRARRLLMKLDERSNEP